MVVRLSSIDQSTGNITYYDQQVEADIRRFNIGGICLFQGGPKQQAALINHLQEIGPDANSHFHRCGEWPGHADV